MRPLNLALRFLLELAALAAFGYWGYTARADSGARIGFAVLAPLVVSVIWGLFIAPKASLPVPPLLKQLLALIVFTTASVALSARGHRTLAITFIAIAVVNALVLIVSDRSMR